MPKLFAFFWIQGWKQGQESHHSPVLSLEFFSKMQKKIKPEPKIVLSRTALTMTFSYLQRLSRCFPWWHSQTTNAPRSWTLQWEGYVLQLKNVRIKAALLLEIVLLVLESAALQRNNYNTGQALTHLQRVRRRKLCLYISIGFYTFAGPWVISVNWPIGKWD